MTYMPEIKCAVPPQVFPTDTRPVRDVMRDPNFCVHDPNSLHFDNTMLPVIPGNGGNKSYGDVIEYDHQAEWSRRGGLAGPVREFFARMIHDNRVKRI